MATLTVQTKLAAGVTLTVTEEVTERVAVTIRGKSPRGLAKYVSLGGNYITLGHNRLTLSSGGICPGANYITVDGNRLTLGGNKLTLSN